MLGHCFFGLDRKARHYMAGFCLRQDFFLGLPHLLKLAPFHRPQSRPGVICGGTGRRTSGQEVTQAC